MTDKDIEICLKDLEESEFGMRSFKSRKNLSNNELITYAQEYRNLKYLENDLKLIHILLQDTENVGSVYFLSSKGKEVLKKGNWIKYCKDIEKEENSKKRKERNLYYVGIIIPVLSTIIALLAVLDNKLDSQQIIEQKERITELKLSIEKDKKMLRHKIDSLSLKYHKDIRILNEKIEKKK